jgi:hypothetical protein
MWFLNGNPPPSHGIIHVFRRHILGVKDETLKAAYNVQAAVEGEYLSGAGIFANPNDGTNFKPFLERLEAMPGRRYKSVTADAGYESEENYAYLAENRRKAYIKPANYEGRKTKKFREDGGRTWGMTGKTADRNGGQTDSCGDAPEKQETVRRYPQKKNSPHWTSFTVPFNVQHFKTGARRAVL